ncbi:MAG: hypothetical protein JO137_19670 [Hyphomicrobiales bacterium]|nr:hypothetical protein [Hyphomicrobiales bacterium]MBV9434049.1 hypothetical protein [Hyphomicrobiales bacterium]
MEERRKIEERLHKKEQEISNLEDRLRTARIYVAALQDILKMLVADGGAAPALKAGSMAAKAREAILNAGRPLHVGALLDALDRVPSRENRASITSSLAAYVRRGEIFTRPAPNTFGLSELSHGTAEIADDEGPPAGFGRVSPTNVECSPQTRAAYPTQAKLSSPPKPPPEDNDIPF